jgi:UDP-sulfoquinovose synthase
MGEYGTPNIDIEEGWLDIEHKGRKDRVLFPKKPSSFYHLSKVHDSNNLEFACRNWGLKVTDLNQGIVYGAYTNFTKSEELPTSFHYDSVFGTVINRFISQAIIGHKLTVYGSGEQIRAYLHIDDVIQCISLAIDNPPNNGDFKVRNQFTQFSSVNELALLVQKSFKMMGDDVEIDFIKNPRIEEMKHYFNPINDSFKEIGLRPKVIDETLIQDISNYIKPYSKNIDKRVLIPNIKWNINS